MTQRKEFQGDDLVARLAADRALQLEICAALECLADSLPQQKDSELARSLLSNLEISCVEHVLFQEKVVFPLLLRRDAADGETAKNLGTLEVQHMAILGVADEVTEQLRFLAAGERLNSAMFGYLLRHAFQTLRSHIEFEQRVIDGIVPPTLAPVDRARIASWIEAHPLPAFSRLSPHPH